MQGPCAWHIRGYLCFLKQHSLWFLLQIPCSVKLADLDLNTIANFQFDPNKQSDETDNDRDTYTHADIYKSEWLHFLVFYYYDKREIHFC